MEIPNNKKKRVYIQFVERGVTSNNKPTTKTSAKMIVVELGLNETADMLREKVVNALKV